MIALEHNIMLYILFSNHMKGSANYLRVAPGEGCRIVFKNELFVLQFISLAIWIIIMVEIDMYFINIYLLKIC